VLNTNPTSININIGEHAEASKRAHSWLQALIKPLPFNGYHHSALYSPIVSSVLRPHYRVQH
jgi:hypothetical protein